MEHEVFVPVPPTALRRALGDPTRVPDCVPGLRAEPGPEPRTAPGGDGIAVHGRLRLRAGSHTITYRGALRLTARPDDSWALHVSATEARGEGSVRARLSLTLAEAEGGTRVRFAGSGEVAGRLLDEAGPQTAESALHRLLNRFAANLGRAGEADAGEPSAGESGGAGARGARAAGSDGPGTVGSSAGGPGGKAAGAETGAEAGTDEEPGTAFGEDAMTDGTDRTSGTGEQPEGEGAEGTEGEKPAQRSAGPEEGSGAEKDAGAEARGAEAAVDGSTDASDAADIADAVDGAGGAEAEGGAGVADAADLAKDDAADTHDAADAGDPADPAGTPAPGDDDLLGIVPDTPASVFDSEVPPSSLGREEGPLGPEEAEPPAEAAHARRTMIGRSAEEVDHAPPRGRYAPEAVGGAGSTANTLRWAAPVAALVVASAVVAGRALRRRH
ncbi:hypothetical protein [Streptomyces sp. SID11385]|uniref:hypothetical protein n=1 Tax=Streptomyces sp. SID11385 TaxID=2706031 RepID=UPI0013CB6791|nr:hypothetical protein [Streptomyces sp. SID11385]NEA43918.1 hypothetical protein [Streptomyces sp. SID11385]